MASREAEGKKVILPVWHGIEAAAVAKYSPLLADRVAVRTNEGIEVVVRQILSVIGDQ